jgi:hypothetical protein
MKFEVTKKEMRREEVYSVGYCALQYLLRYENPIAYSHGVYGWACDYYKVEGAYICTGYNPIGKVADYKMIKKYEAKAEKIITKIAYEKQKTLLSHLLKNLIKELRASK